MSLVVMVMGLVSKAACVLRIFLVSNAENTCSLVK